MALRELAGFVRPGKTPTKFAADSAGDDSADENSRPAKKPAIPQAQAADKKSGRFMRWERAWGRLESGGQKAQVYGVSFALMGARRCWRMVFCVSLMGRDWMSSAREEPRPMPKARSERSEAK